MFVALKISKRLLVIAFFFFPLNFAIFYMTCPIGNEFGLLCVPNDDEVLHVLQLMLTSTELSNLADPAGDRTFISKSVCSLSCFKYVSFCEFCHLAIYFRILPAISSRLYDVCASLVLT